jgi:hypothetical protein
MFKVSHDILRKKLPSLLKRSVSSIFIKVPFHPRMVCCGDFLFATGMPGRINFEVRDFRWFCGLIVFCVSFGYPEGTIQ